MVIGQTEVIEREEPKPELNDRITILTQLYHEKFGEGITDRSVKGSVWLETKEQVYTRVVTVTQEAKELDLGWLKENAGYVLIENLEGTDLKVKPSPEEQAEISKRVILVDDSWEIEPKMHFLAKRKNRGLDCYLCCLSGKARCRITVSPR